MVVWLVLHFVEDTNQRDAIEGHVIHKPDYTTLVGTVVRNQIPTVGHVFVDVKRFR